MEKLTPAQQQQLKKISDERLRVKLVTYGYKEKTVLTWEKKDLLARYAEVITAGARPKVGLVTADPEIEKMRLKLERQKLEIEMRQAEAVKTERKKNRIGKAETGI